MQYPALLLIVYSLVTPFVYGASGTFIFPWYIWPASLFFFALIFIFIMAHIQNLNPGYKLFSLVLIGFVLISFSFAQLVLSFNTGTQEFYYRRSIGLWIKDHPVDGAATSVMLEPIGYIGYFCDCYVHDTVGLVSPTVTEYKEQYGDDWYFEYLETFSPTYLILREWELQNLQQLSGYENAMGSHYSSVHIFEYIPEDYFNNPFLTKILGLGSATRYQLLARNNIVDDLR